MLDLDQHIGAIVGCHLDGGANLFLGELCHVDGVEFAGNAAARHHLDLSGTGAEILARRALQREIEDLRIKRREQDARAARKTSSGH